ncbi:TetR/AcrR family transcriptional regulator [Dactylosporangium sp. CA-233914]|uniref:TetR/AcrR family transcriptional regulator n=1 Tax=Dactylosporangium sp. CA-233914 TaxID=3239934 RepID=UPI003D941124
MPEVDDTRKRGFAQQPPMPETKKRADFQRSRDRLIETVGLVMPTSTRPVTLRSLAQHAGLGQATAYRHFSSLEELLGAYFESIVGQLNAYSQASTRTGPDLFEDVAQRWIDLVLQNGRAMVQIRSSRGYLERLHADVDYVVLMDQALKRPIEELLASWQLPPVGDRALQLWNILFDPREVLDLLNTLGMSKPEICAHLITAFKGALHAISLVEGGRPSPWEQPAPGTVSGS